MIEYRQQQTRNRPSRARRRRKKEKDTSLQEEQHEENDPSPSFHLFPLLPTEIKLLILSFVAKASMKNKDSNLTLVLPLVSKEFHELSKSDYLWQPALTGLVEKEPVLWKDCFLKLYNSSINDDEQEEEETSISSLSPHELVTTVYKRMNEPGYFRLYRMILARYMRFTCPIFCMADRRVQLGMPISLHFFEPRYRLLISQVMEGYPDEFRDGRQITTLSLPFFVYAHVPPFSSHTKACLVQVHRCMIEEDGTANVLLMPTEFVRMERVWEAPNTGGLRYATCLRISEEETCFNIQQQVSQSRLAVGQMPCCIL